MIVEKSLIEDLIKFLDKDRWIDSNFLFEYMDKLPFVFIWNVRKVTGIAFGRLCNIWYDDNNHTFSTMFRTREGRCNSVGKHPLHVRYREAIDIFSEITDKVYGLPVMLCHDRFFVPIKLLPKVVKFNVDPIRKNILKALGGYVYSNGLLGHDQYGMVNHDLHRCLSIGILSALQDGMLDAEVRLSEKTGNYGLTLRSRRGGIFLEFNEIDQMIHYKLRVTYWLNSKKVIAQGTLDQVPRYDVVQKYLKKAWYGLREIDEFRTVGRITLIDNANIFPFHHRDRF